MDHNLSVTEAAPKAKEQAKAPAQHYSRALFFMALLTFLAAGSYDLLPEKHWKWLPQEGVESYVYSDVIFGGSSEAKWINEKELFIKCNLVQPPNGAPFCGLRMHLTNPWLPAADLTDYKRIDVDIDYVGGNKKLRFYMMEFVPGYSNPDNPIDDGHAKYLASYVPTEETTQPFVINMNEFLVADWWVNDQNVPRQFANASRKNIMTFGIDIAYPSALGEHKLKINSVTFVGPWVTAENWYLGIVMLWATALVCGGIVRFYYLRIYTSQLQTEKTKFQHLSMRDPLTGLLNRYGLMSYFENEFSDEQEVWPIAMILLDLDHFKRVNDTYGHNVGDAVLTRIANVLRELSREEDKASRWGGEEFLMLLPSYDIEQASVFAERLRNAVMEIEHPEINEQQVTISIGVGLLEAGEPFENAFKSVDDALYKAKSCGRNCFVCKSPDDDAQPSNTSACG